jgi:hypothetical protein
MVTPELLQLLAPKDYASARLAVPALIFADVALGVRRMSGLGGEFAQSTRLWAIAACVQVVIAVGGTALLVPRLGLLAAAGSLFAGTAAASLVAGALANRIHPLPLPTTRSLIVVLAGAAAATVALSGVLPSPLPLGVRLALVPAFAALAMACYRVGPAPGAAGATSAAAPNDSREPT